MSALRGYDAWLTREPDWYGDEPPMRCSSCGGYLKRQAEGTREWVMLNRCTGQAKVLTCTYDAHADAAILQIIGDEFAGKTYEVAYPPECGGSEPQWLIHNDGDIDPKKAASYRHDAHWYVEEYGQQAVAIRTCGSCGHINEEPL